MSFVQTMTLTGFVRIEFRLASGLRLKLRLSLWFLVGNGGLGYGDYKKGC